MKRLRQLCAVTVLTILLSHTASAEGVMYPGYAPPAPTPPPATGTMYPAFSNTGEVNTAETQPASEESTVDSATEIMLLIIQNMLALL